MQVVTQADLFYLIQTPAISSSWHELILKSTRVTDVLGPTEKLTPVINEPNWLTWKRVHPYFTLLHPPPSQEVCPQTIKVITIKYLSMGMRTG